jgi:hypothetical protein
MLLKALLLIVWIKLLLPVQRIKIFYYWWWRNYIRHPFADKIELTLVHHTFEADAFFPVIKEEEWVLQQSELQLRRQASI